MALAHTIWVEIREDNPHGDVSQNHSAAYSMCENQCIGGFHIDSYCDSMHPYRGDLCLRFELVSDAVRFKLSWC